MWWWRSFRGVAMRGLVDREVAGHGRALAYGGIDAHLAAVQLDKGAHQRQAEPGAAMPGPLRVALEPVEHLVLGLGRNAWSGVGHREHHAVLASPRADGHGGVTRRESDRIR